MTNEMPRLKKEYLTKYKQELQKELELDSVMQVPVLEKIVVNAGLGEALDDKAVIDEMRAIFEAITGQKPVVTKAKKANATFKIRKGYEIGMAVTLRGDRAWYFFDKLTNIVFPRVKDFRGVSAESFDGSGNYSIGIKEHTAFPEIDSSKLQKVRSLQVTLVIKSGSDEASKAFLDKFGFPFVKDVN